MTYKTLLVHAGPAEGSTERLRVAAGLSRRFEAAVVAVGAMPPDPWAEAVKPYVDEKAVEALRLEVVERAAAAEAEFRREAHDLPAAATWRTAQSYPFEALMGACAGADLIIVSRPTPASIVPESLPRPGDLVMASGLPVLVAPRGQDRLVAATVVVGWKNTRESRRAIGDALPFLVQAERVIVSAVCSPQEVEGAEAELDDVLARLARHGIEAECETPDPGPLSAGQVLVATAREAGADLIVAGGYGHSRLREWFLGGVTQHLLAEAPGFVLLSR